MRLLRWIDDPMPRLAWRLDPHETERLEWIHPADRAVAQRLSDDLRAGHATATLRLAGTDGEWLSVEIAANIVLLDQHTTAALFTMRPKPGKS
jgi:hypothetical protein